MKNIKYLLLPVVMTAALYYYSCDDSGIGPNLYSHGRIWMTAKNLRPLDPNVEGIYQLWVVFADSLGNQYATSAGTFNANMNSDPVDTAGNPVTFNLGADSSNISRAIRCYITIGNGAGDPRLLAGSFTDYGDSIAANDSLSNTFAVGDAINVLASYGGSFILNQPTSNNAVCERGIWFTNINGVAFLPLGMLDPSSQWTYEGWVVDTATAGGPYYYSTGKFRNPTQLDDDGAGSCRGTDSLPWSRPGQDWVGTGGGCLLASVTSLRNGHFQAMITLEPVGENVPALAKPFFLWLLKEFRINAGCGATDNMVNYRAWPPGLEPSARVAIYK